MSTTTVNRQVRAMFLAELGTQAERRIAWELLQRTFPELPALTAKHDPWPIVLLADESPEDETAYYWKPDPHVEKLYYKYLGREQTDRYSDEYETQLCKVLHALGVEPRGPNHVYTVEDYMHVLKRAGVNLWAYYDFLCMCYAEYRLVARRYGVEAMFDSR